MGDKMSNLYRENNKQRPRMYTKLMPNMMFVEGVEYPVMYDMSTDTVYINRKGKHKPYAISRSVIRSVEHETRRNTFKGSMSLINAEYCVKEVEDNIATYLMMFYAGKFKAQQKIHINEVIESWVTQYKTFTNGADMVVDWSNILQTASFFVPRYKLDEFYRKSKIIKRTMHRKFFGGKRDETVKN